MRDHLSFNTVIMVIGYHVVVLSNMNSVKNDRCVCVDAPAVDNRLTAGKESHTHPFYFLVKILNGTAYSVGSVKYTKVQRKALDNALFPIPNFLKT